MFYVEELTWRNLDIWLALGYCFFVLYYSIITILEIRSVWRRKTRLAEQKEMFEDEDEFNRKRLNYS